MLLHFDAIHQLTLPYVGFVWIGLSRHLEVLSFVFFLLLRKDWRQELKVTTIKLKVDEFINELTRLLTVTFEQLLDFKRLDIRKTEFLEVRQHFDDCLVELSFKVLEIDEDSLLLTLKAIAMSLHPKYQIKQLSTYLIFIETHEPVRHVIQQVDSTSLVFSLQRRMSEVNPADARVLPASAECVLVVE